MSGFNLPPGCTNADIERQAGYDAEINVFEEEIQEMLEKEGISQPYIARIMEALSDWYEEQAALAFNHHEFTEINPDC